MKKLPSTFVNMTISLLVITLFAGLSLGYVNGITEGPKAQAKLEKKINAVKMVLPPFNNNPINAVQKSWSETAKDSIEIYPALTDKTPVGVAVIGQTKKGFSGLIKLMVGFLPNGDIFNIKVLEQKETPGLGTKMKDDKFINQFVKKNLATFNVKVKKDGGAIDALAGATITSRAFGEAVQMAYDQAKQEDLLLDESKKEKDGSEE